MQLPPDDRSVSPRTGYTRAHWESAADALLAAVEPYASEDRALYHFPADRESWSGSLSHGLEGYARTLLPAPPPLPRGPRALVGQPLRRPGGLRADPAAGRLPPGRDRAPALRRRARSRGVRGLAPDRGP